MKLYAFRLVVPQRQLLAGILSIKKQWIMRINLTTFLLVLTLLHLSAKSYSQKVNLEGRNITLKTAFRSIEQQTGYVFFNTDIDPANYLVTISLKNAGLTTALDACLEKLPLSYRIVEKTVVIRKNKEHRENKESRPPDTARLTGKVLSDSGKTIAGAVVAITELQKTSVTGSNGEFLFSGLKSGKYQLMVSYIGYKTFTTTVAIKPGENKFDITLNLQINELEETVVKGYYNTTNRLNTGSVTTVKSETIEKQPVADVLQSLAATVPGLEISQTSGMAGSGYSTIQIRGVNSLGNNSNTSSSPLFLIDGVQVSGADQFEYGINPLNSISPTNIESVTVLKDADATAIYGSRGANGVILITTKKGQKGKLKVQAGVSAGANFNTYRAKMLTTEQYLAMRREAFKNDGEEPDENTAPDLFGYDPGSDINRYTNWQDELTAKQGRMTDAQVSFSGGNEQTTFLIAAALHRETPTMPGNFSFERPTFNFNIGHSSLDKRFTLAFTGNYGYQVSNFAVEDVSYYAYLLPPNLPDLKNPDGSFNFYNFFQNPYAVMAQTTRNSKKELVSNLSLGYRLADGLTFKTTLGYADLRKSSTTLSPLNTIDPAYGETSGNASFNNSSSGSWQVEPQLEYSGTIGKGKFSAMVGGTYQNLLNEANLIVAHNYSLDANLENYALAGSIFNAPFYSRYKYLGVYARLNYNLSDKYLLNLTGRRDGSSRFGPGRQFGNFGAAGAAWIFGEEQLVKENLKWLSFGKLRASYGIAGNDQIGDYQYLNTYDVTSVRSGLATIRGLVYDGITPISPVALFNPDFGWETTRKLDLAVDLGVLDNRILLSVNWYHNRSSSQLINYSLPPTTGFSSILKNFPAIVGNTGWEFDLKTVNIKTKDFSWNSAFNLSIPRNRLIAFPGLDATTYANKFVIGQPISVNKVFRYLGVDQQTGIYTFADKDGNPTSAPVANQDQQSFVNTDRRFYGALSNVFSYRGWQLTVVAQFIKQMSYDPLITANTPGAIGNFPDQALSRWQNQGDRTNVQKFTQNTGSDAYNAALNAQISERAYIDGSFIRIKNVALSYDLRPQILDKLRLGQLKIFLNAQNLFTISNYPGNDPETGGVGFLPPARTIVAGLQCSF